MAQTKVRDSNVELARIVAMAMIVIGHFIFHGIFGSIWPGPVDVDGPLSAGQVMLILLSFIVSVGMILFILISGYFGIRLKWKSIISFWLICVFYNVVNLCVNGCSGVMDIVCAFTISRAGHWFMRSYFLLILLSPIINAGIDNLDLKHLRIAVGCTVFVCCFCGWLMNNGNGNGRTFLQLLSVYIIGAWIRRDNICSLIKGWKALAAYFICVGLNMIATFAVYYLLHKEYGILFQRNNPLIVLQGVLLFCWFRGLNFQSKFVNTLASTVIGVLLLSDFVFFSQLYGFIRESYSKGGFTFFLICAGLFIAVFAVSFVVEYARKTVAAPVADWMSRKLERFSIS